MVSQSLGVLKNKIADKLRKQLGGCIRMLFTFLPKLNAFHIVHNGLSNAFALDFLSILLALLIAICDKLCKHLGGCIRMFFTFLPKLNAFHIVHNGLNNPFALDFLPT